MANKCAHGIVKHSCSICSVHNVYAAYKYKAEKQRGLIFTLTLEQFKEIVERPCEYCGEVGHGRGVDRRNNHGGYTPQNSQAACWVCNKIKGTLDHNFLMSHIDRMWRHAQRKKLKLPVISEFEIIAQQRHRIKELEAEVALLRAA